MQNCNTACHMWVQNLVCHFKVQIWAGGVQEWGAKEDLGLKGRKEQGG